MSIKRMSLRFNLDRVADRKAWEYLQSLSCSRNQAVIEAINRLNEPEGSLVQVIETTILNCFKEISVVPVKEDDPMLTLSEEENDLLDSLDDFLGGYYHFRCILYSVMQMFPFKTVVLIFDK